MAEKMKKGPSEAGRKTLKCPHKQGINLNMREQKGNPRLTLLVGCLAIVILAGCVAKFGVIDQYRRLDAAQAAYASVHTEYTQMQLPIGEAFSGVLLNYLRYVIPDGEDSNRWRWPMRPYWLDMLEVLTPISIYTAPGLEYNVDRCREYVVNQAGNAIDCLIKIYGLNEFRTMIDNRSTSTNPKYENLVQQYRFERLAARCGRVFG